MSIRIAAAPMTRVAIQARTIIGRLAVKAPITDLRGREQNDHHHQGDRDHPVDQCAPEKRFIGLIGEYWMTRPASTLTAMTP